MSMYLRETLIDTTDKLWDDLYRVRMPYALSRSIGEIQTYGLRVSGIKDIDKGMRNEIITTMIPIERMVELYEEGVPVGIPDVNDTKLIYEAITEHLMAWKEQLRKGININNAPIKELILFDRFAHEVYAFAKYEFVDDEINSLITSVFRSTSPITIDNIFKPKAIESFTGVNKAANIERESLASYFSQNMPGIRRFN